MWAVPRVQGAFCPAAFIALLQIALDEIGAADYQTVRKPGGYIMGIIKRHRRA